MGGGRVGGGGGAGRRTLALAERGGRPPRVGAEIASTEETYEALVAGLGDVRVVSGPGNGLTHWLGVTGLGPGEALELRACCEATDISADTASCPIRIEDLKVGDHLSGYLG